MIGLVLNKAGSSGTHFASCYVATEEKGRDKQICVHVYCVYVHECERFKEGKSESKKKDARILNMLQLITVWNLKWLFNLVLSYFIF